MTRKMQEWLYALIPDGVITTCDLFSLSLSYLCALAHHISRNSSSHPHHIIAPLHGKESYRFTLPALNLGKIYREREIHSLVPLS